MSLSRHSRNSSEKGVLGLNDKEIQEEMLNADLKALGIAEDEISNMAVQEKHNLLTAIKQSTNPHSPIQSKEMSPKTSENSLSSEDGFNSIASNTEKNEIDISIDSPEEYPCLPSPGNNIKYNLSKPRTKKIEQTVNIIAVNPNQEDVNDSSGDEFLLDFERKFSIPGFIDDNGESLNDKAKKRPVARQVHYYTLSGQSNRDAVRSMLRHYNLWYKSLCSSEKGNASNDVNEVEPVGYLSDAFEDDLMDPLTPEYITPVKVGDGEFVDHSDRRILKKSPSPDIEEVEITEVRPLPTFRQSQNEKAKTLPRETRRHNAQPPSTSSPSITLDFDNKWDPETGLWSDSSTKTSYSVPGTSSTTYNNAENFKPISQNQRSSSAKSQRKMLIKDVPAEAIKVEPKVQCPICQFDFWQSKVESHAAICEGFPAETRSNAASFSTKAEESNTQADVINSTVMELTDCNPDSKTPNKKRAVEPEDQTTAKRICVTRS